MLATEHKLTGIEKASVLLMSIGPLASAKVFEKLSPVERDLLGAEIIRLQHVDSITKNNVMEEVNRNIASYKCSEHENVPFRWLENYDPEFVYKFISKERAANIALISAHLSPKYAAEVLSYMDDKLRNQVTLRLASMKPVSKEAVEAAESVLKKRVDSFESKDNGCMRRRDTLLKILGGAKEFVKDSVLGTRSQENVPECISSVDEMLSPEDMIRMNDVDVRSALSEIQLNDLLLSLRVASDELKTVVFRNVSDSVRDMIVSDLESSKKITLRDVDAAQKRIVAILKMVGGGILPEGAIEQGH